MNQHIFTEKQDGLLRIAFNRAEKKNAITFDMCSALAQALQQASADPQVRVALIRGSMDAFTAGNDLDDFLNKPHGERPPSLDLQEQLLAFDKPLVAAVAGVAVGIGSTMLLHCDYCASGTSQCARISSFPFRKE